MPISLTCPNCRKPLKARDESAGGRVRCPHCQSPVPVPAAGGSGVSPPPAPRPTAPAPVAARPPAPAKAPAPPPPPPRPAPVASPEDWGAEPAPAPPPVKTHPTPLTLAPEPPPPPRANPEWLGKDYDRPPAPPAKAKPADPLFTTSAGQWKRLRGGLGWVRIGLFFIGLLGLVPVGKEAYVRFVEPLPTGDGWIQMDDQPVFLSQVERDPNAPAPVPAPPPRPAPKTKGGAKPADVPPPAPPPVSATRQVDSTGKLAEIDLAAYGVPLLFGSLALFLGRATCAAAPKVTGAKGLFAWSGLLTLLGVGAAGAWFAGGERLFGYPWAKLAGNGAIVALMLGEAGFLLGLGLAAGTLRWPGRSVGRLGLAVGLAAAVATVGWDAYVQFGRALLPAADRTLYEKGAGAVGWVLLVAVYVRGVGAVRRAIDGRLARPEAV